MLVGLRPRLTESVLVHDPIGLDPLGRAALVKNKGFLDTHVFGAAVDGFVGASGLPIARYSGSIRADAVRVLPVPRGEEVPLFFSELSLVCT